MIKLLKLEKRKPAFFISLNKCLGCCLVCNNSNCIAYGETEECDKCKNKNCIYSGYNCKNYDCQDCKNINCINNIKFDPKKQMIMHC
ncbi:MAG TPA: hypothetical protein PKI00_00275 [Candidatus Pacearchaeota archaeon]|nr:hypothetical protein [Candidatus Pacearchaeota archaeon]